jgi:hypothetical protein
MSRGPQTFRQRDITAALKAARLAGTPVARVEISRDGRIVLVMGKPSEVDGDLVQLNEGEGENPWDKRV